MHVRPGGDPGKADKADHLASLWTDEEKKRVLQMIFTEIRADHTDDGVKVEFKPRPIWEPYVEAVLARQRQENSPAGCYHFRAEDGGSSAQKW